MNHPLSIRLTDQERDALERYRAEHGLRSLNEAVKKMIADVEAAKKDEA